jgi:beta-lactamase class A
MSSVILNIMIALSKIKFILLLVFVFILGLISFQIKTNFTSSQSNLNIHEIREKGYKFIDPLLRVDIPESNGDKKTVALKTKIEKYLFENGNLATNVSVYFRNPSHYRRFTISQEEKYAPASILKVITMIAYLKRADLNPELLNKKITFDSKINSKGYNFFPKKDIIPGETYTVDALISYMIIYSSNDAQNLLTKNDNLSLINDVLDDLQLEPINANETENIMDVYTYASFFRTLYNATYLSKNMSEKALALLSQSDFKDGLVAGLSKDIIISHKFGERNNLNDGVKQLHDCGIIYYPNNTYLLCVMTRGSSFDDLEKILKNISTITYKEVENWKGN